MDGSRGNYVERVSDRAVPPHRLHSGGSGSTRQFQNRSRNGFSGSQQLGGRRFGDDRTHNESGSSSSRSWREADVTSNGPTSPSHERSGSSPIVDNVISGSSGQSEAFDTRYGLTNARDRQSGSSGRGTPNDRVRSNHTDDGSGSESLGPDSGAGWPRSRERAEPFHRRRRAIGETPSGITMPRRSWTDAGSEAQLDNNRTNESTTYGHSVRPSDVYQPTNVTARLNGREEGAFAAVAQQRGEGSDGATSSRRHGGETLPRDAFRNTSGEGSHDRRRVFGHSHREGGRSSDSWGNGRQWRAIDNCNAGEFARDSVPGSNSGEGLVPRQSVGRAVPQKHDWRSGGESGESFSVSKGFQSNRQDPPSVRVGQSGSVEPLWKARKSQIPQLVEELAQKLARGTVECMICYDMVGRGSPVWSCASCYAIFHLSCIRKWARAPTSADLSVSSSDVSLEGNWRCPGCQTVEFIGARDLRYYCFCGQLENPPGDYHLTPHSCGAPCKKALDKSKARRCDHYCTMQCHPGPCPPCAANAPPEACPCGKRTFTRRCGEQKAVGSCGQACGRLLLCGRHECSQVCHEGPCQLCVVEVETQCFCGDMQTILTCGQVEIQGNVDFKKGLFSCALPCSKSLNCGNHNCQEICHPGMCGECELAPSKVHTCPCGKKNLTGQRGFGKDRKTCLDDVPTCSQRCEKTLRCGVHPCQSVCHTGACPPCQVPVEQSCRCGSTTRSVSCCVAKGPGDASEENAGLFLCEKKCGQKKNCGKHRCNNRCCPSQAGNLQYQQDGDPHQCLLNCGKKLRCKQHSCQELCHSGHCPPCLESVFTELSCACGNTTIPPPSACGTPLPSCQQPCSFAQECGHSPAHPCHFGECPPCAVPVSKECVGNHVVLRGVPCGSREIKCTKLCGKTRQCGLHACGRTCHVGPCDIPGEGDVLSGPRPTRMSCGQLCGAPRRDCSHTCMSTCHPSSQCPENACKFMVKISCQCGRISGDVYCDAGGRSHSRGAEVTEILSKLPSPLQPTNGTENIPLGQRKLQCDDDCGKMEKRRLLADAFGVDVHADAHLGETLGFDLLSEVLRRDPVWVLSVEERFKAMMLGPKGTGDIFKVHVFCGLPKEKRDVITQLAERWSLSVRSTGREPWRFAIVNVNSKSKVPLKLLSKTQAPYTGRQASPPFNAAIDMDPRLVVGFFDVPREIDVSSLVLRFAGECELVWLNDKNALAIFGDVARATTALRRVDHTSAYKGAISLVGPVVSTSGRDIGGMKAAANALAPKPIARRNVWQEDSNAWVEDAWEEQKTRRAPGAWQRKNENSITTTRNPWVALEQSSGEPEESGMGETVLTTSQHSGVLVTAGDGRTQGGRAAHVRPPSLNADGQPRTGNGREVSTSQDPSAGDSSAQKVEDKNRNSDVDDWENLLD